MKRLTAVIALGMGAFAPAPTAEAKDWTQFYIGVGAGADVVSTEIDANLLGLVTAGADDLGTSGIGASARIGADYQVNNWLVVGAFANLDWSDAESQLSIGAGGAGLTVDLIGVERAWSVGLRAGTLVTPDTLSYLLLGYTHVAFDDISFSGLLPALKVPDSQGIVVGSGFEHRLTPNISLTGEYRAAYLDEETLFAVPGLVNVTTQTVLHTGRVGFAYRFGGGESDTAPAAPLQSSWTGFYGGIGTGVSGVDGSISLGSPLLGGLGASLDGIFGGDFGGSLMIGYDHRIAPSWVLGVFGSIDKTMQDAKLGIGSGGLGVGIDLPEMDELYTVAARAGYLASPGTMIYGLLGYSHLTLSDLDISALGIPLLSLGAPSYDGITYGGGIETLIGKNLSLRAEYRYADMSEETLFTVPGVLNVTSDADVHTSRVFLTYRFDQ